MYFYFSCERKSLIKSNGEYLGAVDGNSVMPVYIKKDNPPFIEITPDCGNTLGFCPDENFLNFPPEFAVVADLCGGYLIKIKNCEITDGLRVIAQKKTGDAVFTVFSEGGYKLSIETAGEFYSENIGQSILSAEISTLYLSGGNLVAVILKGTETTLNIYSLGNGIKKLFSLAVSDYSFDGEIITVENTKDIAKREITRKWQYVDGKIVETDKKVLCRKKIISENIPEKLIPYHFSEDFLYGGGDEFLCDEIKAKKDALYSYLGDYSGIMPPPPFRRENEVGFIYKTGERRYTVKYIVFTVKEKKIVNLAFC